MTGADPEWTTLRQAIRARHLADDDIADLFRIALLNTGPELLRRQDNPR